LYDDDPVAVYLREVSTVPPLTREEEIELLQHALGQDPGGICEEAPG